MAHQTSSRDHLAITREAGIGRVSLISVFAGMVTAYGTFAIVASIVGAFLTRADVNTDFRTNDWTGSGAVAALGSAVALLLAYLFGGYVAGRMARRSGVLHGVLVFLTSLIVAAVAGGVVAALTDNKDIRSNLRSIGVPTSTDQLKGVAIAGAAASLAAILIGAVAGGALGERWHTKLARRAADPEIGPASESRALAAEQDERRRERVAADPTVRRDVDQRDAPDDEQAAANGQAEREAAQREAAQREAAEREAAQREAAQREAAQREAAEREAAQREAAQREAAQREAAERDAAPPAADRTNPQETTDEAPSAPPEGGEREMLTDEQWRAREQAQREQRRPDTP